MRLPTVYTVLKSPRNAQESVAGRSIYQGRVQEGEVEARMMRIAMPR